ncbi:hypothetical protein OAH87_01440 [Marinomonas sp.]|nr:hypothetical protein [Marinomonas sp.]MDB4837115.1 hypothetical protein [Marinomonas sp.]
MFFELLTNREQYEGKPSIAVLLSDGLSDTPFSIRNLAKVLQEACYHVRVILLLGYGAKVEGLLEVSRDDW